MRSSTPALVFTATLAGCGVAGRPIPPGPLAPTAPGAPTAIRTPTGLEVHVPPPSTDLDGGPVSAPLELLLYVDAPDCQGRPTVRGPAGAPLPVPVTSGHPVALRAVAAVAGRQGPPGPATEARWSAPPAPPEPPLAFTDATGRVQLSWLSPEPPATGVRLLRDGEPLIELTADHPLFTDEAAPPGPHAYALESLGPGYRTGPSAVARIQVPPPISPTEENP